jgi:hypothetical protein
MKAMCRERIILAMLTPKVTETKRGSAHRH